MNKRRIRKNKRNKAKKRKLSNVFYQLRRHGRQRKTTAGKV